MKKKPNYRDIYRLPGGDITVILRSTKPLLSPRQYKELLRKVNQSGSYESKFRIISEYIEKLLYNAS